METLFLQARGQSMTAVQKQRLQLIQDNLILLQWRLRNAGFWPANLPSDLQRDDQQVAALLAKSTDGFELFPGIDRGTFGRGQRALLRKATADLKSLKISAKEGQAPKSQDSLPKFDATTFMIYARRDTNVRIVPQRISNGAYFASYLVAKDYSQIMGAPKEDLVASGILTAGAPITFAAKANTVYYLYIPPRKTVEYELTIENAGVARAALRDGTITLYGNAQPLYVYYPSRHASIGAFDNGGSVTSNSYPGASAMAHLLHSGYTDARVAQNLDSGWRFHPDPQNDGVKRGVTSRDFDDHSWKTVSATMWWQKQGFADYHGPAWYRIHFTAPALQAGQTAWLYFGAVDGDTIIYLNGQKIGEHPLGKDYAGWDKPFSRDATSAIRPGDNVLVVQVTSKPRGSSGIIKGVSLLTARRN
jgi:hypothetical protein